MPHVIGTAGHVDHGKSALVLALTGTDPDRLAEEKARGMTIDLGFAWTTLPSGREVGFVDVPGHERFVHNMLAGATGIDAALLIVSAAEGIKPQTVEHLQIMDLLGLDRGVVALTKADLVDDETLALVEEEARGLVGQGVEIVPVSAPRGARVETAPGSNAYGRAARSYPTPRVAPREMCPSTTSEPASAKLRLVRRATASGVPDARSSPRASPRRPSPACDSRSTVTSATGSSRAIT
jgi:signal recognition particle receptor subunit beta